MEKNSMQNQKVKKILLIRSVALKCNLPKNLLGASLKTSNFITRNTTYFNIKFDQMKQAFTYPKEKATNFLK